ncbi:MerR family transcriptional regulator [Bacillus sp. FJAT-27264]|uniref:MerR family transcriptional regulator n=1 Tax=Paenibacillus agri TaxID=2744309 RepID=A0A850EJ58_9BACL|nr:MULTISPECIES: MerR family transcriptional regulator [Bacillales]NUU59850.1 MerR family transcriptional regulator [Paenibacillus agri]OBZ19221.1 MerR family transcriptional regulator [Bacillus sp. FJAT-27264]
MEKKLSIQDIAALTGLSTYTLRYYENIGLLSGIERDAKGYRVYSMEDISCIEFVIKLRDTDMPISQIKEFSDLRRQGNSTVIERKELLEVHQANVIKQMKELGDNLIKINEKINHYKKLAEQA